jgi:glycosyltransferase involved in cell wall biosynthesis
VRILVATPWLYPRGGGLERYAWTIASELAKQGHEIASIGHGDEIRPGLKLSNTPLSRAIYAEARRRIAAERPDVVHVHTPVPGTAELVAHAARREGVPYVVTYHAGRLGGPRGLLTAAARLHEMTFERQMLRGAAGLIGVSPFVAQNALKGMRVAIIPPGVDTERFRPQADPIPGRVLFVGPAARAYRWKGLHVLTDAITRVPGAHLRIVGEGDLAESYRGQGATVTGRVSDVELVEEYSRASVVVLPSITSAESFGMVLAEANACERPVIGSDVGGIPSFVRDGENGFLVAPGDAGALADSISTLLADGELARRMGKTGRAIVEREHRWPELARATARVLEEAASGRDHEAHEAPRRSTKDLQEAS